MNEEFEKSLASRQRTVSRFLAQEMLFDFFEEKLDSDRRRAMLDFLPTCKDTQKQLDSLRSAQDYVKQLSTFSVSPQVEQQVVNTKLGLAYWSEKLAWKNMPDLLRWSIEAFVVAVVVAFVVSVLPLKKLKTMWPGTSNDIVLSEVDRVSAPVEATTTLPPLPSGIATPPEPVKAPTPLPTSPVDIPVAKPAAPPQIDVATNVAKGAMAEMEATENVVPAATGSTTAAKKPKGFVYRAFMSTHTIAESTEQIKALMEAKGAEKAGEVELGWRKPSGSYFHLSLPESNYEPLLVELRNLGPVRIYKDPHWRVMPEGQIRLILFVEDLSLKK